MLQLEGARESAYLRQVNFYRSPLSKNFQGVVSGVSLETSRSNMKAVALTVLELLAFNAQKFKGSRDPGHGHFSKKFLRDRVRTVPGSMHDVARQT